MYDEETNLYYLMARYYHPKHGVFISVDPDPGDEDDPVTQNGYTYANNNPVMGVDPDGNFVWMLLNAGFAAYDGYQAYKSGGWKAAAVAVGVGLVGGAAFKAVKAYKVAKGAYRFLYKGTSKSKILWGSWSDYKKVTSNGQTYAKVGNRLYSKHAVDRMQPSGNRYGSQITQAGGDYGRSVSPTFVENVIRSTKPVVQQNGNLSYKSGTLQVITNKQGAVVTIITR